jgi:hypothetical protein
MRNIVQPKLDDAPTGAGFRDEKQKLAPIGDKHLGRWQCEAVFIDEREMLRRLPISRRTLHTWRTTGKIPSIKIGRRVLFSWNNVAEALGRMERGGGQ